MPAAPKAMPIERCASSLVPPTSEDSESTSGYRGGWLALGISLPWTKGSRYHSPCAMPLATLWNQIQSPAPIWSGLIRYIDSARRTAPRTASASDPAAEARGQRDHCRTGGLSRRSWASACALRARSNDLRGVGQQRPRGGVVGLAPDHVLEHRGRLPVALGHEQQRALGHLRSAVGGQRLGAHVEPPGLALLRRGEVALGGQPLRARLRDRGPQTDGQPGHDHQREHGQADAGGGSCDGGAHEAPRLLCGRR